MNYARREIVERAMLARGYSREHMAELLGMDEETFEEKLAGRRRFRRAEYDALIYWLTGVVRRDSVPWWCWLIPWGLSLAALVKAIYF